MKRLEIRDWRLSREIGDWRLEIMRERTANLQSLISNLLVLVAFLFLTASPVAAQSTQPEDQMYQIAKQLNCPTCAGRNLADCPTDTCTQWKQEITAQLKAGKRDDEVLAYFKDRFGSQVLQEPPKEGFLLVMWVVPIVAVIGLIALAIFVARRSASSVKLSPATSQAQASDYETQLEQQIKDAS
jgi:cytochrome c-type biogenesis protein CcmH